MSDAKGLVGGRQDLRVQRGHVRPIEHRAALNFFGEHVERDRAEAAAFVAHGPLEIEIGFGRGQFLAALAESRPDTHFLAFETRTRWCWSLLNELDALGLDNARVIRGDVRSFLDELVPDGAVAAVYVLFPDPWWKKRHHKRRLFTETFLDLLHRKLATNGSVWVKSDVPMTIQLADEAFAAAGGYESGDATPGDTLPKTYREERCLLLGLPVRVRRFVRVTRIPTDEPAASPPDPPNPPVPNGSRQDRSRQDRSQQDPPASDRTSRGNP